MRPKLASTEMPKYRVGVRSLCEFTAKRGDLDIRFTPGTSAKEGMAGHRLLASRRNANYQRELSLYGEFKELSVRGRADGYDPTLNRLEEFKTHRGDLSIMASNQRALHWAQLKVYGALLCRMRTLETLELALVYLNMTDDNETILCGHFSADELDRDFVAQCERFLTWAQQEMAHRLRRNQYLKAVAFPLAGMRPAQRTLAQSIYKAVCAATPIMAQAPTGIGKTIGTLFPLLKAAPKNALDKIFFLVAKTSGRIAAVEALKLIVGDQTAELRVLEYASRESACLYPGRSCNAQSCPLAKGFYDRLPPARLAAISKGMLDQPAIRAAAASADVCPYYLTQELARWADVIVADYHYYFDVSASLYGLTVENQWRVAVLVDEAHNLLPRARSMFSTTLVPGELESARRVAPAHIKRLLERLKSAWPRLESESAHGTLPEVPRPLLTAVDAAAAAILDAFADNTALLGGELKRLFFSLLKFSRLADTFANHSLFDASCDPECRVGGSLPVLSIRNVVPAAFLAPRFSASAATVLFSATLAPAKYFRELLGLPLKTSWINVESPFRAGQLSVRIAHHISTRYADRPSSIAPIIELVNRQYRKRPGNYLAFFSSFDYLDQVFSALQHSHPDIDCWKQLREMNSNARSTFLTRFALDRCGIGFAVLGGVFGEGIDLPGNRLIGAFIATLGLPQINAVNKNIEQRMHDHFGSGYEYTYLYPGLQKVIQAAGRVIRTTTDTGCVHLMDDRFMRSAVKELLPAWWEIYPATP